MTESTELKPGDTIKLLIGGKTLILEPIPYGRMKKLMKYIFSAMDEMSGLQDGKAAFTQLPAIVERYIPQIVPLIFSEKKYPFINQAWIDDNITYIHMKEIFEKGIIINGLKDFLGQMGKPTLVVPTKAAMDLAGGTGTPGPLPPVATAP